MRVEEKPELKDLLQTRRFLQRRSMKHVGQIYSMTLTSKHAHR